MRLINLAGRAHLQTDNGAIDIAQVSDGKFGPDPQSLFADWKAFAAWGEDADTSSATPFDVQALGPPVPAPRQVFAIGLNYSEHALEAGFAVPETLPPVFTKFASALTGPEGELVLSGESVDWEVELVAVIGTEASQVKAEDALSYVAGVTVGQDFSDRAVQMIGPAPQFSMGKSFPGYGPTGPALVTLDEVGDLSSLRLQCWVDGELVQDGIAGQMINSLPLLVERLSAICTLHPGDLIFTGTPAGVGMGRTPARYLTAGEVVRTEISGLGSMTHRCVSL
ncbi:MAG: fumarylacetoacetate hydrolase [Nocardioides sp.]|jgi:2,4-diketo-3-deoxy-L-fuconate hydrolase|uniref:fumarylacetoacetate hydrolase family protein n=1 Tax=Nocardioides sp. TaxID=35761 RepID=UPI002622AB77|nr:fumarylacetoacetate hydrolase family protein [Nocardioides sp.]MCW2833522.1 fumarylacetoacetate hydrolase [Nocardioides sp.]